MISATLHSSAFTPIAIVGNSPEELQHWFEGPLPQVGDTVALHCYKAEPTRVFLRLKVLPPAVAHRHRIDKTIPPDAHDGECKTNPAARQVCDAMYAEKCDAVLGLVEALYAVKALAGEDRQIAKIVDDAIAEHMGPDA